MEESESPSSKETFASLGLSIGAPIIIETLSGARKYSVTLMGYLDGRSILISPPLREGKEVLLDKDSVIAMRMLVGKKVCAFETKVAYRSIHPYTYYHLEYPEEIEALQVRNSERVNTDIIAQVDSDFDIVGEWPKPAFINNLSKTGARLSSPISLGEKGHELHLSFQLSASGIDISMTVPCIIRNIDVNTDVEVGDEGRYIVGVQFINLTDEQRLTLSSYIYENER